MKAQNTKRCMIVGGAPIKNYERIRTFLSPDDFVIFCDSGMIHRHALKLRVDLWIGDFDSHDPGQSCESRRVPPGCGEAAEEVEEVEEICGLAAYRAVRQRHIIRLPKEKDDTDTAYAVKYALNSGYRNFILIGVFGALADHSLANLGLLKHIEDTGGSAVLVDDYSVMQVLTGKNNIVTNEYPYFSLLPIYGKAEGVTIKHAKYNVDNVDVSLDNPFTVSNETLEDDAVISIKSGALLLIKSERH